MPFYRQEEDELWMVFPPKQPRPHFLNETAFFILQRCSGEHDVSEIILQLSEAYSEIPVVRLQADAVKCLSFLKTLGLIHWDLQQYIRENIVNENVNEGTRFRPAGESDFGRISESLQQYFQIIQNVNKKDPQHLMTPVELTGGNYDDIQIRTRQFRMIENFFCLEEAGELKGISSVRMVSGGYKIASFVLIAVFDSDSLQAIYKDLIQETVNFLKKNGAHRVRLPLIPRSVNQEVKSFLKKLGFTHEATLLDELGLGQNLEIWSIKLDESSSQIAAA
jgi:hypothetical protein